MHYASGYNQCQLTSLGSNDVSNDHNYLQFVWKIQQYQKF
jgi:hypothetical protein